jgi:hypothetical protein
MIQKMFRFLNSLNIKKKSDFEICSGLKFVQI